MTDMVPMYGFGGNRGGGTVWVYVDPGSQVTLTHQSNNKSKTAVADSSGKAVFKGLSGGQWEVVATLDGQTAKGRVIVSLSYSVTLTYFTATINITYPAGLTCTATDGTTTLTAPDTSGTWACTVNKAGTWTISAGDWSADVVMATSGKTETVRLARWIVKNGVPTDIGFATTLFNSTGFTITQGSGFVTLKTTKDNCAALSDAMVDITDAKTVIADIDAVSVSTGSSYPVFKGNGVVLTNAANVSGLQPALNAIKYNAVSTKTGRQTVSIDVGGITGSFYAGISMGGAAGEVNVYSLRAEV